MADPTPRDASGDGPAGGSSSGSSSSSSGSGSAGSASGSGAGSGSGELSAHHSIGLPQPEETWVSMELLQAAQAGDAQALDDLLARYQDRVRRVVRVRLDARLRGLCESADVVQETLAAALTRIAELRIADRGAILRWLTRIAENEMIDLRRRAYGQKRDRRREQALETRHDLPGHQATPADQASDRELKDRVDRAVAGLPATAREVILQRTYFDASWEEVAQQIGAPSADAARKLHHRAMIKLARALADL